ncbi:ArnT family glycosyltransferase [Candidatus Omnitrophota bacterium]
MMKKITIDILFLLLIVAHLIGQLVLLGDFSVDDLAFATVLEQTKDTYQHQNMILTIKNIIKYDNDYSLMDIIDVYPLYPPTFHYLMALLVSFFSGGGYYVIRCGVLLFSVLIFFLLYGYFRRKKEPLTGLWAVLFAACSPFFLKYSTATTPYMFMCLCVLFLFIVSEKTDSFRNWGWSLFLGIMSGLCLFVKNEVLMHCCALYLVLAIPVILKPTRRQIGNLVICLCLFGNFLIYFLYLYIYPAFENWYSVTIDYTRYGGMQNFFSEFSVLSYSKMLFTALIGPYFTGIVAVAGIIYFIKPHFRKERNIIFLCVIPIIIFSFIITRSFEYVSPLVPLIAILCARGISMIPFRVFQGVIVIIACYLTVSAYAPPLFNNRLCTIDTTQFEFSKIWDMVDDRIVTGTPETLPILIMGNKAEDESIENYFHLRVLCEGNKYDDIHVENVIGMNYARGLTYSLAKTPIFIYVSYSEEDRWPTQEKLWHLLEDHDIATRGENGIPFYWQEVMGSKDSFNEVARVQATIGGKLVYVFLYENRKRIKEKEA